MSTKIVHIIPTLAAGGAERLVADLCAHLPREHFENVVVATVALGAFADEVHASGARAVLVDSFIKKPSRFKCLRAYQRVQAIAAILKKESPDIVHTHLTSADIMGWFAAKLAGMKHIISTEHNINADEKKWQTILKRYLSFVPARVVCISDAIREFVKHTYHIAQGKLQVIYDGVDTDIYMPRDAKIGSDAVVSDRAASERNIVTDSADTYSNARTGGGAFAPQVPQLICVARLELQKGHEILLRALAQITDIPWELMLVGDGTLRAYLAELARALGIRERVQFFGVRRDIATVLRDADIFVFPSLWEGFGIAVLEAMSSGLPIIASNTGGISEIVEDGETGLLVPPGDADKLAQALRALLADLARARELGARGRTRAEQCFSLQRTIENYKNLYISLIKV